ncbi:hypothetical protein DERF_007061 [Dermatophagoides farinae]|uniref:Uncharacterized protein n=1 Tax=Dermatophagoides farinae TaxID=6954 RepID=A0A922L446_DERFA|nr:hypothetical protein DERF_007061 [Dermatophagoides farinae]
MKFKTSIIKFKYKIGVNGNCPYFPMTECITFFHIVAQYFQNCHSMKKERKKKAPMIETNLHFGR